MRVSVEYWRQKALINYHTGYVVATFTILQIVGGILLTSIMFEEFSLSLWYELLLFFMGTILSFIGVGIVVYDDEHHKKVKKQKTQKKLGSNNVALEPINVAAGNVSVDHSVSGSGDQGNEGNGKVVTIAEKTHLIKNTLEN